MKELKLKQFPHSVSEFAGHHIYNIEYGGETLHLQGLTSTLISFAFPNTYAGISEQVLKRAAERGTAVHKALEDALNGKIVENRAEVTNGLLLLQEKQLECAATEYLVFGDMFATKIDNVSVNEKGEICLIDYKTTSSAYEDKVALQLSFNAEWFEAINPKLKVAHLYEVWLYEKTNTYRIIELQRVPKNKLDELEKAYASDDTAYKYQGESNLPSWFGSAEDELALLTSEKERIESRINDIKAVMLEQMQENGIKKLEGAKMVVSYIAEKTTLKFDAKAFEKDHSDVYELYKKESKTKAMIQVRMRV